MRYLASLFFLLSIFLFQPAQAAGNGEITFIQMGDLHGHLVPRPNVSSDHSGRMEGGLARMYTKVQEIRAQHKNTFLVNTGDTIQGSAEALFTQGQAMVDVLNMFGIQAYEPGNWDFLYGPKRFMDLFGGHHPKAPWFPVAANLYYNGAPFADKTGQRVLPPYLIRNVGGLKVGILGLTTYRGIPIAPNATKGFKFTDGEAELKEFIPILRQKKKVDVLVVVSELGLADNIVLADKYPGIDAIFSSDMHEITRKPVITPKNHTLVSEVGQDGILLGEVTMRVNNGKVTNCDWKTHDIDSRTPANPVIASLVKEVRRSFVKGPGFKPHINPLNGTVLTEPIDTVVGYTKIPLYRDNFSDHPMPGVIEGSSHDFLTDAFRSMTNADIGALRGFRYGTHVVPGAITLADLYHFIPIGPFIAKGTIPGTVLKKQMENAADGALNPDIAIWTGGWLFNYSGLTSDLNVHGVNGMRFSNIKVYNAQSGQWAPFQPNMNYSYASYYYPDNPGMINITPASNISVLKGANGQPMDATEVVVKYLASLPNRTVDPKLNRIRLLSPLPPRVFDNPEIQPLKGVDMQ